MREVQGIAGVQRKGRPTPVWVARKSFREDVIAKPMLKEERVRQKGNALPWVGLKEQPVQRVDQGS